MDQDALLEVLTEISMAVHRDPSAFIRQFSTVACKNDQAPLALLLTYLTTPDMTESDHRVPLDLSRPSHVAARDIVEKSALAEILFVDPSTNSLQLRPGLPPDTMLRVQEHLAEYLPVIT